MLGAANPDEMAQAMGEIFRVEGVTSKGRSAEVVVAGRAYSLHSFDPSIQRTLRRIPRGSSIQLVGELGVYRGRLQFVIHDRSWLE